MKITFKNFCDYLKNNLLHFEETELDNNEWNDEYIRFKERLNELKPEERKKKTTIQLFTDFAEYAYGNRNLDAHYCCLKRKIEKNLGQELKSYACSLDGKHWDSINALSPGKAKSQYKRTIDLDFPYTIIKCKCKGYPYTSEEFIKNAKYRNIEFAYCGMGVQVQGVQGVIVGYNDSANLDVLFLEGKIKGQVLNCHPNWRMKYFDKKGSLIKSFD